MTKRRNWTWQETLVAFRLYCLTPFGKLHQHNPAIIRLAQKLGRTPSAVGMKACNFASLDPSHKARGIAGLKNTSRFEAQVWQSFAENSEALADEAEQAFEQLNTASQPRETDAPPPLGPTESTRTVKVRRVQAFFRAAVLTSYQSRCALTGLAVPALLNASHIIPWSTAPPAAPTPPTAYA